MPQGPFLNNRLPVLWHGGDYNPEQWPRAIWDEDMRLMEDTRFKVASIGIFSWAQLEPEEDRFDFEWLDDVIERLTKADRWFILATPSAAAPNWMSHRYPETLRTGPDRVRRLHGNRVNYNISSPIYRTKCRQMATILAQRYGNHPHLLAWHLSNEYGGPDYGQESEVAFRHWLRKKFNDDLDALNQAYWTAFWSHTYRHWDEIEPPGGPYGEISTAGLLVDWRRFTSDQTIDFMLNEAGPLKEISPDVPLTTNMMGAYEGLDYRRFAPHIDFISWDSYPGFEGHFTNPENWLSTAFKHDLMRSLKPGRTWLLMESSPSSGNWYPYMILKPPGTHRFEGLQAVAHGADGVQYFQWRQGRGAFEQYHGAVVSHSGTGNTRVYREVRGMGEELEGLGAITGSTTDAEVAVIFDWENRWAIDDACGPSRDTKKYEPTCREFYRPFWAAGVPVDLIGMDDDFTRYKLLVAPMLFSLRPGVAERIGEFVEAGGTLVTTYMTGWVDENSLVFLEGQLSPLRKLLGIWSEELDVLLPGQANAIDLVDGNSSWISGQFPVSDFCELIHAEAADVLGVFRDSWFAGRPALTENRYGAGHAYYIAARTDRAFGDAFFGSLINRVGLRRSFDAPLPEMVTAQRRSGDGGEFVFVMNANDYPVSIDSPKWGLVELPARGVAILREPL